MEMMAKWKLQQSDKAFLKKLIRVPRGLEKKTVPKYELAPFFNVISLEDLVFTLYQFEQNGYFKHQITLSHEYDDWEEARASALLDTSPLKPIDPFIATAMRQRKYRLAILDREIKTDTPLTAAEVSEVMRVLPTDLAERFLRFKLSGINQKNLREIVVARPDALRRGAKADNYYTFEHKGLFVSDTDASYKGKPIHLARKQRELLKAFVARPEVLLNIDDFTEMPEVFDPKKTYNHPHQTLSKLISETHKIVRQAVGECIFNKPDEGWYLKIG